MMLLPFLIFCNLFSVIYSTPILKNETIELHVGTNVSVCCRVKPGNDFVLFVHEKYSDKEEKIFTRKSSTEVKKYDTNWNYTNKQNEFCLEKFVDKSANDVEINCFTNDDGGLGKVVDRQVLSLKVIHLPVITKFLVVSNETHAKIDCLANGSPDLNLQILTSENQLLSAERTDKSSLEIKLVTDKLSSDHKYTCLAQVKYVKDYQITETASSFFEPILLDHKELVNTIIGVRQNVTIVLKSNPAPNITCSHDLAFKKQFESGDKLTYSADFDLVTKADLITYTCTAANIYGSKAFRIQLLLRPTQAKRWSDERGIFDNYYQLTWETTSRAGLQNFTIDLYKLDKSDGAYKAFRNETILINSDNEIKSNMATLSLKNYVYRISYHVKDLTSDTQYRASVTDCNSYGCQTDPIEFKTNSENNMIPVAILQNPPQTTVVAALSKTNSVTATVSNDLSHSILLIAGIYLARV